MYTLKSSIPNTTSKLVRELNWLPDQSQLEILENNNFQCDCCGLVSRPHKQVPSGFIEIASFDDKELPLCSFCMQSQNLSRLVSGRINHGLIIYCPSLSQGQVSKLALYIYASKLRGNGLSSAATNLLTNINKSLIKPASKILPILKSGEVQIFVDVYNNLSPDLLSRQESLFEDLKYLPSEELFKAQVAFWNKASLNNISDLEWS